MKESHRTKPLLIFVAGVAAMALLLAGCGGSGSVKKDPKPQAVDMAGVNAAAGLTMPASGSKLDLKAGASGDLGEITFTCAAGGDDCSVTVTVTDGTAAATATGGMVTAAPSAKYTKRVGDARKKQATAMTKAAATMETAIKAEATQETDAGLGGSQSDGSAVDTYSMTISRDRSGTKIKVTDTGMAGDSDPKFGRISVSGTGLNGLARTQKADSDGNVVKETVVVKTDIEAPKAVPFAEFKVIASDGTESTPQQLLLRDLDNTKDADNDGDPANDYTAMDVSGNNDLLPLIKAGRFKAPTSGNQLTFDGDDTSTDNTDEADEVSGTYNGSPGTYRCTNTGTSCTVDFDDQGEISGLSGWIFTPRKGATTDQPDYDYLHYGFWLKQTTKDGVVTYNEVETFAGSSMDASDTSQMSAVEGSATYKGGATGVYVKNAYNTDGSLASATSGHFTANASLMANFGGDDVAVNSQWIINGTIDNFILSGPDKVNSWSVALDGTSGNNSNNSDDASNAFSGTADGGGAAAEFSGTYHGSITPGTDNIQPQPHTVVGEFNANFTNGTVAGAFGARKQ